MRYIPWLFSDEKRICSSKKIRSSANDALPTMKVKIEYKVDND